METKYESSTGVTTWMIKKWYEKVIYGVGLFVIGLYSVMFIFGILSFTMELLSY